MTSYPTNTGAIRPLQPDDIDPLTALIDATGLFPGAMLRDMAAPYLADDPQTQHWWVYDVGDGKPGGVAYAVPETMTEGTWNLLLIAVHPDWQGHGLGTALMRHAERQLREAGGRLLLVETSGLADFAQTRRFYVWLGYREEARIADFYQAGEDKVIFTRRLE